MVESFLKPRILADKGTSFCQKGINFTCTQGSLTQAGSLVLSLFRQLSRPLRPLRPWHPSQNPLRLTHGIDLTLPHSRLETSVANELTSNLIIYRH